MDDCNNKLNIRILNQSTQLVKAIVRVVNGINVESLSCQIIIAGKSEYICIPQDQNLQNAMIYLYTSNTAKGQWSEFAVVQVSSLDVNLLWVTEVNKVVMLTPYGCSNQNGTNGELYYLKLTNTSQYVTRIYVSYTFDGKINSKKMPGVTSPMSKKLWIPVEATKITIKAQYWLFGWRDIAFDYFTQITKNYCYETFLFDVDPRVKENHCDD